MTSKLQAISNATLGFLGLNTQDSGVTLEQGYATKATNCIIDKYGRLGSRKGWTMISATSSDLGSNPIEAIYEFKDVTGNTTVFSAGNGKLFTGTSTLVRKSIYGPDSGGPVALATQPTFESNRWQFCALAEGEGSSAESYAFATQAGEQMLVWREGGHSSGTYVWQQIGSTGYGSTPSGFSTFDPDCCHSAFGRVWAAGTSTNKTTIFWSQLQNGAYFSGTGSGLIDISRYVGNNDEIVAINSHHKYLIVFCKNNIVVLDNPTDPSTTLAVADVITGVGCYGRDTVQQTGTDIVFLSRSGVRSLARTIQENSMPMRELSLNIKDEFQTYIDGDTANNIRTVYSERDAFYLITFPSSSVTVYFDLKQVLPNGAARVTIWNNLVPKAMHQAWNKTIYFGQPSGIGYYTNYTDNGNSYRMEYFTANTDFGQPFNLKLLKKCKVILIAGNSQTVTIKYGFDYSTNYSSSQAAQELSIRISEYNVAEYGANGEYLPGVSTNLPAEYGSGLAIVEVPVNLGGTGKVLQFGIESEINGAALSLQQFSVYVNLGKLV